MTESQKFLLACQIATAIINDITVRKGIGDEWNQIDEQIRMEIYAKWSELIRQKLS